MYALFNEINFERLLGKIRALFYRSHEQIFLNLVRLHALFFQQPWFKEQEEGVLFCFSR